MYTFDLSDKNTTEIQIFPTLKESRHVHMRGCIRIIFLESQRIISSVADVHAIIPPSDKNNGLDSCVDIMQRIMLVEILLELLI